MPQRFTSDKYSDTGETLPYEEPPIRELSGHRGGIKHYRSAPQPEQQAPSLYNGRLRPSAMPRSEERYP